MTPRRPAVRFSDDQRAQMIADKIEVRARIDQLSRSVAKMQRRLDYLTECVPDE